MRAIHCLGIAATLTVAIGSLGLLTSRPPRSWASQSAHVQADESDCAAAISRTLSSSAIRTCESCGA